MKRKFKKVVLGLLAHITPSICFGRILWREALVNNSYIFSEQPFYGNYSTIDSHKNTVISHAFAYSSRWDRKPWQGLLPRHHWKFSLNIKQLLLFSYYCRVREVNVAPVAGRCKLRSYPTVNVTIFFQSKNRRY